MAMHMLRAKGAFTLLELLVVVTIIVILLAVLLPSLDKAISYTERVTCAANLHGIGLGTILYATDYKVIPQRAGQPGTPEGDGYDNGYRAGGGHGDQSDPVPDTQRPLYTYAAPRAFKCPSDSGIGSAHGASPPWKSHGSSYWLCPSVPEPEVVSFHVYAISGVNYAGPQDYFTGIVGRKPRTIRQTSKQVLLSDSPAFRTPYNFGTAAYSFHDEIGRNKTPEGRQNAWNNLAFTDGSVAYIHIGRGQTLEEMQDDFVHTDYSFAYNVFEANLKGSRGE